MSTCIYQKKKIKYIIVLVNHNRQIKHMYSGISILEFTTILYTKKQKKDQLTIKKNIQNADTDAWADIKESLASLTKASSSSDSGLQTSAGMYESFPPLQST